MRDPQVDLLTSYGVKRTAPQTVWQANCIIFLAQKKKYGHTPRWSSDFTVHRKNPGKVTKSANELDAANNRCKKLVDWMTIVSNSNEICGCRDPEKVLKHGQEMRLILLVWTLHTRGSWICCIGVAYIVLGAAPILNHVVILICWIL